MVTYLAREGDAVDFGGAVVFEESGAGGEGVAGRRDIIDEPDAFSLEEIFRSTLSDGESAREIFFPRPFIFLS